MFCSQMRGIYKAQASYSWNKRANKKEIKEIGKWRDRIIENVYIWKKNREASETKYTNNKKISENLAYQEKYME